MGFVHKVVYKVFTPYRGDAAMQIFKADAFLFQFFSHQSCHSFPLAKHHQFLAAAFYNIAHDVYHLGYFCVEPRFLV